MDLAIELASIIKKTRVETKEHLRDHKAQSKLTQARRVEEIVVTSRAIEKGYTIMRDEIKGKTTEQKMLKK